MKRKSTRLVRLAAQSLGILAAVAVSGCATDTATEAPAVSSLAPAPAPAAEAAPAPAAEAVPAPQPETPLRVAAVFGDGAVLQRDLPAPVWGWAAPGVSVTVTLSKDGQPVGEALTAKADETGRWKVALPAQAAGGPYTLAISQPGETVTFSDVLFGDVWICSGQSNMEMNYGWGLTRGKEDMETNNIPNVRLFIVQNATDAVPRKDVAPAVWKAATSLENVRSFSAVGYFFGTALHQAMPEVPIGLIDSTWSGTYIQTWLSLESMDALPEMTNAVARRRAAITDWQNGGREKYEDARAAWQKAVDTVGFDEEGKSPADADYDLSAWKQVTLPATMEKHVNGNYDGSVWYVRKVVLTAEQAAATNAVLSLGAIDDQDTSYVNGKQVGLTKNHQAMRRYKLPAGLLCEGTNTIAVRAVDLGGIGGFTSPAKELCLKLDGDTISLADTWSWKDFGALPVMPPNLGSPSANSLSACYNAMMRPLFPLAVKGAIWYQGCSNVGGHKLYEKLFPAMAADWRAGFSGGDFPIYLVQLAAFLGTNEKPVESDWAAMRWSMMQIGETLKNSGTAVAIDIGDHHDIHPKDKKTVGERLARLALVRTYGDTSLVEAGPIPEAATLKDGAVEISFRFAEGLKTSDGEAVSGFQLSVDGDTFVWADAVIDGSVVRVTLPEGTEGTPKKVRFAWDHYPVCNLVNGADLPCGPFEFDVK